MPTPFSESRRALGRQQHETRRTLRSPGRDDRAATSPRRPPFPSAIAVRGGDRSGYPGAREAMSRGSNRALTGKRAFVAAALKQAADWRESRRCHCGALGYQSCIHRPNGADGPVAERFPFHHRTCAQWTAADHLKEEAADRPKLGGGSLAQRPTAQRGMFARHSDCQS
jgi:hypothetical protein